MKLSELVACCKSVDADCIKCEKEDCCSYLSSILETITPIGLMNLIEDDEEIDE